MTDTPRVCVLVSTYQRGSLLPALVAALERQTLPLGDFEVVIADNGSTDDTPSVLRALQTSTPLCLRVVAATENRGSGAGRNVALSNARAPVVAFTDDDCRPAPRWLESGLARFAGSTVGVVQGRTLADPSTRAEEWAVTQHIDSLTHRYETCNVFYRTDQLRAVGGFDETLGFFGEDTAAGWSVVRTGARAVYAHDAVVYHIVTHPGIQWHLRRASMYGKWPRLVRTFPDMRRTVLWHRVFLERRNAAFVAAVAGVLIGLVWRPGLALAAPYAWMRRPRPVGRHGVVRSLQRTAVDAARARSLVAGSVRERTLVL